MKMRVIGAEWPLNSKVKNCVVIETTDGVAIDGKQIKKMASDNKAVCEHEGKTIYCLKFPDDEQELFTGDQITAKLTEHFKLCHA